MEADASVSGQKVFGIGFHKTGTTSLGAALDALGYATCDGAGAVRQAVGHPEMMRLLRENQLEPIMRVAEHYEAFTDNPWFMLFRALDRSFPGSKFILTVRDERSWLESAVRYFGQTDSDLRAWIYGSGRPLGNEQRWLERYREHIEQVKAHFCHRPDDLLVVDWEQGGGWKDLARFLGRSTPAQPFPHITKERRPAWDLTDAIFVLTHPRTGSSLVMQTLRLLGAAVTGSVEHPELPISMNPRGFFEEPELLRHGLHAPALDYQPALLRGRSIKLALHPLAKRASGEEWTALAQSNVALILPIRTPAEWLVSSRCSCAPMRHPPAAPRSFAHGPVTTSYLSLPRRPCLRTGLLTRGADLCRLSPVDYRSHGLRHVGRRRRWPSPHHGTGCPGRGEHRPKPVPYPQ